MRLINVKTLELEEGFYSHLPKYAILSHTWGSEEITFQQWQAKESDISDKAGYKKIRSACKQADRDGYTYLWCDTNCINKESSAELTEAINSMYAWYEKSAVCYVYLSDTDWFAATDEESVSTGFSRSRWITRGWTLQELLAPRVVKFFDRSWKYIGTRDTLALGLSYAVGMPYTYLNGVWQVRFANVSEKMNWLFGRETTRIEDMAYCMLGIFGVNMPPIYGEGEKAFLRLQEEIVKSTFDHTIFCWRWMPKLVPEDWVGILSPSPDLFYSSAGFSSRTPERDGQVHPVTYAISNGATSISLPCLHSTHFSLLQLDVRAGYGRGGDYPCLLVKELSSRKPNPFWYRRSISKDLVFLKEPIENSPEAFLIPQSFHEKIYVRDRLGYQSKHTGSVSLTFLYKSRNSAANDWRLWPGARQYYGEWDEGEGRFYLAPAPGFEGVSRGVFSVYIPRMIINKGLKDERKWGGKRLTVFFAAIHIRDRMYQLLAEVIPEPKSDYEAIKEDTSSAIEWQRRLLGHKEDASEWRLRDQKEDAKYKQKFEALTRKALSPEKFDGRCFLEKVLVFDLSKLNSLKESFVDRHENYVHLVQFCPHILT